VRLDPGDEAEHVPPVVAGGDRVRLGDAVHGLLAGQRPPQLLLHVRGRLGVPVGLGPARHVDARLLGVRVGELALEPRLRGRARVHRPGREQRRREEHGAEGREHERPHGERALGEQPRRPRRRHRCGPRFMRLNTR
jgi:hypothetical protein